MCEEAKDDGRWCSPQRGATPDYSRHIDRVLPANHVIWSALFHCTCGRAVGASVETRTIDLDGGQNNLAGGPLRTEGCVCLSAQRGKRQNKDYQASAHFEHLFGKAVVCMNCYIV